MSAPKLTNVQRRALHVVARPYVVWGGRVDVKTETELRTLGLVDWAQGDGLVLTPAGRAALEGGAS